MRTLKTFLAIVVVVGLSMVVGCGGASDIVTPNATPSDGGRAPQDPGTPPENRGDTGGASTIR